MCENRTFQSDDRSNTLLDYLYIMLLNKFKMYNSKGNNLCCSYMSVGQNYENELLVIAREPSYWPDHFTIEDLNKMGPEHIYKTKVYPQTMHTYDSSCP